MHVVGTLAQMEHREIAFCAWDTLLENRGGEGRGEGERRGREKERRRRFRKSDSFMKSIRVLLAVSRLFPLTYEMF